MNMKKKTKLQKMVTYDFSNLDLQESSKGNCFDGPAPCDASICDEKCDCDCDCNCDSCDCEYVPNGWEENL